MEGQTLAKACYMYFLQVGAYPEDLDPLFIKPESLTNEEWNGPYIDWPIQNDPWGQAYALEFSDTEGNVTIRSNGPDGIRNNEDDIVFAISKKTARRTGS